MKSRKKRIKEKIQFAQDLSAEQTPSDTRRTPQNDVQNSRNDILPEDDVSKPNAGALTLKERQKVDDAVSSFLELHQLSRDDLGAVLHPRTTKALATIFSAAPLKKSKEFKKFPAKIKEMSGVNRTSLQIYWYMKRAYSDLRPDNARQKRDRIKWTKEEDKELKRLIAIKGVGNWAAIERAMGKIGVKDRYDCLISAKNGTWTQEEEVEMLEIAQELMDREGITDRTKFNLWTEMAARMKTRTYREIARHYKLMGPRFNQREYLFGFDDYKDLLHRMIFHFDGCGDESEIIWSKIIDRSDMWSAEKFRNAWEHVKQKMVDKLGLEKVSRFTFRKALGWCLDHLSDLGCT